MSMTADPNSFINLIENRPAHEQRLIMRENAATLFNVAWPPPRGDKAGASVPEGPVCVSAVSHPQHQRSLCDLRRSGTQLETCRDVRPTIP